MTKDPTSTTIDRLFIPAETANLLGLSLSWLAKARLRGDGPRYVKIGRAVRYPESAIRDYLRARTRTSTSER
jgi:predicted DNA-binding transcriptional regulator AlpA